MDMRKFLLVDSDGKPSTTMTAFFIGFLVVNVKLILSGLTIGEVSFDAFTGSEYAAAVASLGAIYVLRRNTDPSKKKENQ